MVYIQHHPAPQPDKDFKIITTYKQDIIMAVPHKGARKYRSRKNRPCDFCRRRRMACLREEKMDKCLCCKMRNLECTYTLDPIKKRQKMSRVKPTSDDSIQHALRSTSDANAGRSDTGGATTGRTLSVSGDVKLDVQSGNPCYFTISQDLQPTPSPATSNSLELHNGRTSVFVGFSGDQDPFLLQKISDAKNLPVRDSNINYDFRNASNVSKAPIFFSICPTEYLDPRPDHYNIDKVRQVAKPFEDELIEAFFATINCSYPIVNRSVFLQEDQKISATFLASIFSVAYSHLGQEHKALVRAKEARGDWFQLFEFITRALPLEQGAPTLQTVQALLVKLQRRPLIIRDANAPSHWVQTASLVALGQDLGLNLDPSGWDIPPWERRLRRRLWWAIYVQDKWESIGLSRPTHIREDDFRVEDITEDDFLDENEDTLAADHHQNQGVKMFIALIRLTKVLSDMLLAFYSVKSFLQPKLPAEEILAVGVGLMNRLNAIENMYFPSVCADNLIGTMTSLRLAKTTIALSCCKAILYADNDNCYSSVSERAYDYVHELNSYLSDIVERNLDTHWWCYSRVNFSIVGSCILAFYMVASGKDDATAWRTQMDIYRTNLEAISKKSHVTHLAMLRFDKLLSIINQAKSSSSSSSLTSSLSAASSKPPHAYMAGIVQEGQGQGQGQGQDLVPNQSRGETASNNRQVNVPEGRLELSRFNRAHIWGDQSTLSPFVTDDNIFSEWLAGNGFPGDWKF